MRIKLKYLDQWNEERRGIAEKYMKYVKNPGIKLPVVSESCRHVWHVFAVRCDARDRLQEHLKENGIGTVIHYPIPMHLQGAYADLGYKKGSFPIAERICETELSLPMYIRHVGFRNPIRCGNAERICAVTKIQQTRQLRGCCL
jgi:dTDP-4-amino-4,6-dideoxygalactose transaminase